MMGLFPVRTKLGYHFPVLARGKKHTLEQKEKQTKQ
jgi:hypothetical protein